MAGELTSERAEFERIMQTHVAQLMGFAKPYVGRLSASDRELLLTAALNCAWERRGQFKPEQESILQWWDGCLRFAATRRPRWPLIYSHRTIWVSGVELGKAE